MKPENFENGRMIITNARIVTQSEVVEGTIFIETGRIEEVVEGAVKRHPGTVDAGGRHILPGLVDVHGDDLETEICPRPFARLPADYALINLDRKIAACGITTKLHAISNYEDVLKDRDPQRSKEILASLAKLREKLLVRHYIHARCEIRTGLAEIFDVIDDSCVKLVSLMDHFPGQGQFKSYDNFRTYYNQAYGLADGEIEDLVRSKGEHDVVDNINRILAGARKRGVPIASHDDDSPEKVDMVFGLGAEISEFPVTKDAARRAKELGMRVAMGAPNAIRGKSSTGNLSALEALKEGLVDLLCSDYYPASMLYAPFFLADRGVLDLVEATKLVSLNPARAILMAGEIGSIEAGKRADLIVVDRIEGVPVVIRTIFGGETIYSTAL